MVVACALRCRLDDVRHHHSHCGQDDNSRRGEQNPPSRRDEAQVETYNPKSHRDGIRNHPRRAFVRRRFREGRERLRLLGHVLILLLDGTLGDMTTARTVLVSGGNRGIGFAIAERFIAEGHRVAVTARTGSGPKGSLTVVADVTDGDSLDSAIAEVEEKLGPIEVVVANAGITKDTLLLRMTDDDFETVIDTNLTGSFRLVKRAIKSMMKQRFGRVVFISSVVGLYGSPGQINYSASKSALVGFARSLTRELGGRGITANVVAPGFIETDMTASLPEEQQAEYKRNIPVGRFAQPAEVASAVVWLASDDAAYISGAVIPVDGGLGMGH